MPQLSDSELTDGSKYLTFTLADVGYALNIDTVTEIIGLQGITAVPDVPAYIKGVINLRGKVIPVMDVRARFSMQAQAYNNRTCIIVIEVSQICVGLVVDAVSEVFSIPQSDIEPPPRVFIGSNNRVVSGLGKVGDEVKLILDPAILVGTDNPSLATEAS
jgi:purine-binding chemotaxis protein CheW